MTKMDENDIWRLVRQIIEALVYIHKRKIIHRDLVSLLRLQTKLGINVNLRNICHYLYIYYVDFVLLFSLPAETRQCFH